MLSFPWQPSPDVTLDPHTAPLSGADRFQLSICCPVHNIWVIHNSLSLNCHQTCFPVYLCALGWPPNQGLDHVLLGQIKTEGLIFLHSWRLVVAAPQIGPTKIWFNLPRPGIRGSLQAITFKILTVLSLSYISVGLKRQSSNQLVLSHHSLKNIM